MVRGTDRERAVVKRLRGEGWLAFRAPASLGVADVLALRAGSPSRLIEVKSTSTRGPYNDFGPADRQRLRDAARLAGAEAWLAWWPLRRELMWLAESDWPPS